MQTFSEDEEKEDEDEEEENNKSFIKLDEVNDDFLEDLNNDKYISQSDLEKQKKEAEQIQKENEKRNKEYEKNLKQATIRAT
jgi:hypothetical protein